MPARHEFSLRELPLLQDPDRRDFLGQLLAYSFCLFGGLPLLVGMLMPWVRPLGSDPSQDWFLRLVFLTASGGLSALAVFLPAVLVSPWPRVRRGYASLLLPLALTAEVARWIFFSEFGGPIDERLLGLFEGNLSALWAFGREKYHLDLVMPLALIASGAIAFRVHRRSAWFPRLGTRPALGIGLAALLAAPVALALRPEMDSADRYSPLKLAESPLLQVGRFAGEVLSQRSAVGLASRLEQHYPLSHPSPYLELGDRLGADPRQFPDQVVSRPAWLPGRPTHVFCFILESFDSDLIEDPRMATLAPRLRRFHEEGVSTTRLFPASGATVDAIHSAMAGVPAQVRYPGPQTLSRYDLDTLPKLMERAGFRTRFYAASRRRFGNKGSVCEAYGYDAFLGCPDLAPEIPSNEWGVTDGDFYDWTQARLGEADGVPSFVTFLNVSNHAPYAAPVAELWSDEEIPAETADLFVGVDRAEKCHYAKHVRYADREMGRMADRLAERYPGSLFVFFGDHRGSKLKRPRSPAVPLILWGPGLLVPEVDTTTWYGSQMDLPATLAHLVLPEGAGFRSLGRPLWDKSPGRISIGSHFALSAPRDGSTDVPFIAVPLQTRAGGEKRQEFLPTLRRASALEVLAWAHLNREPLGSGEAGEAH